MKRTKIKNRLQKPIRTKLNCPGCGHIFRDYFSFRGHLDLKSKDDRHRNVPKPEVLASARQVFWY